jgi:hypothetical protein
LTAIIAGIHPPGDKKTAGASKNAANSNAGPETKNNAKTGGLLSQFLPGSAGGQAEADATSHIITSSLEKQMLEAGSHIQAMPGNALASALGRANSASINATQASEHLNNALMDYHTIHSLLNAGKSHEADQVSALALKNMAKCEPSDPKFQALAHAFVFLFQRQNMTAQMAAFDKFRALSDKAPGASKKDDAWGS